MDKIKDFLKKYGKVPKENSFNFHGLWEAVEEEFIYKGLSFQSTNPRSGAGVRTWMVDKENSADDVSHMLMPDKFEIVLKTGEDNALDIYLKRSTTEIFLEYLFIVKTLKEIQEELDNEV